MSHSAFQTFFLLTASREDHKGQQFDNGMDPLEHHFKFFYSMMQRGKEVADKFLGPFFMMQRGMHRSCGMVGSSATLNILC